MRIFLVSNMYPSKGDKLYGVFVKNMHEEFKKQGVLFPHTAFIRGRTHSIFVKVSKYLRHYFRIFFYFFRSDYDLFYIHYFSHHIPILWLLLPFKKKPWVINVHGTDVMDLIRHPKWDFFARKVLKNLDLLVVPSSYFKTLVCRQYPFLAPEMVFVSPSGGLDLDHFQPSQTAPPEPPVFGFVSRFTAAKGWKIYLQALALLKQEGINLQGMMIGKGPEETQIRRAIKEMDLEKEVDFIGFVQQDELNHFYNKMEGYVFPSYRESLGLTGLEAMACGKPVIASNIPGIKSYLIDGENGFLFEPGEAEDLARKIKKYLSLSEEEKRRMPKKAIQTALLYERTAVNKSLLQKLTLLVEHKKAEDQE